MSRITITYNKDEILTVHCRKDTPGEESVRTGDGFMSITTQRGFTLSLNDGICTLVYGSSNHLYIVYLTITSSSVTVSMNNTSCGKKDALAVMAYTMKDGNETVWTRQ